MRIQSNVLAPRALDLGSFCEDLRGFPRGPRGIRDRRHAVAELIEALSRPPAGK
jgi:hypothetical protein